jgi:hypothetical protein
MPPPLAVAVIMCGNLAGALGLNVQKRALSIQDVVLWCIGMCFCLAAIALYLLAFAMSSEIFLSPYICFAVTLNAALAPLMHDEYPGARVSVSTIVMLIGAWLVAWMSAQAPDELVLYNFGACSVSMLVIALVCFLVIVHLGFIHKNPPLSILRLAHSVLAGLLLSYATLLTKVTS